jgi:hypothetical protein
MMTWEDLKDMIKEFNEEQLRQTVTIYVREADKFYSLAEDHPLMESGGYWSALDSGHKYLVI